MAGYSGDGGPATSARLSGPTGVAVDITGNIYIADARNNVVRKVSAAGIISTFAGDSIPGYTGDGGAAIAAELNRPYGVALDTSGNLYISDARNFVIRKVNTSGIISTVAGSNIAGYSGDGGAATMAKISVPLGISVDGSGNLYIADSRNNVIRKVSATGTIRTFAGTGVAGITGNGTPATAATLFSPSDVKVDASGKVYIADSSNTVRMVNTGDTINAFAGNGIAGYSGDGGPAVLAEMTGPVGLAIDAAHNVYIATPGNSVIRRVGAPVAGISITSSMGDTTICWHGGAIHFSATAIADTAPHYQWQVNGVNAGTDSIGFTPATLVTGDAIRCLLMVTIAGTELSISNTLHIDSMGRTGTIAGPTAFCVGSNAAVRDLSGPPAGTGRWLSSDTLVATLTPPSRVNAIGVGTDTIYFIIANVCGSDTARHIITVAPNTIAPISGPSIVCDGATVTYTDATTGIGWAVRPLPAGTIDSATGVFTAGFNPLPVPAFIIFATSPACYRLDSIMIEPLPVNAPISGSSILDSGSTTTLTDANPGGVWSSSNTAVGTVDPASGIVYGVNYGTVTITYTITDPSSGCSADTTFDITVVNNTGINNLGNATSFNIFPNPTSGSLNIVWANQPAGKGIVSIADVTGRVVYSSGIAVNNTNHAQIDIASLKAGVYMITIKSDNGYYCSKLLIGE